MTRNRFLLVATLVICGIGAIALQTKLKAAEAPQVDAPRTVEGERRSRKLVGATPLAAQLEGLARETLQSVNDIEKSGFVVSTFKTPVPWTEFRQGKPDGNPFVPSNTREVTVYLELNDGYPVTVSGSPSAELTTRMGAFLQNALTQVESSTSDPAASPGLAKDLTANVNAEGMRDVLPVIDRRAVVLGFVMTLADFRREEAQLRKDLDIWAEVTLNPHKSPFKPVDYALTPAVIEGFRAEHRKQS